MSLMGPKIRNLPPSLCRALALCLCLFVSDHLPPNLSGCSSVCLPVNPPIFLPLSLPLVFLCLSVGQPVSVCLCLRTSPFVSLPSLSDHPSLCSPRCLSLQMPQLPGQQIFAGSSAHDLHRRPKSNSAGQNRHLVSVCLSLVPSVWMLLCICGVSASASRRLPLCGCLPFSVYSCLCLCVPLPVSVCPGSCVCLSVWLCVSVSGSACSCASCSHCLSGLLSLNA